MKEMRRKDRQMDTDFAYSVIDRAEYGTLATINDDGTPYCVPLSLVRKDAVVYFHTAAVGHKLENILRNPKVCVAFACEVKVPPIEVDNFTTEYESAVVFGIASIVQDNKEKIDALRLISEKFTPDSMPLFDQHIEMSLNKTCVVRIDIEEISGKRRKCKTK